MVLFRWHALVRSISPITAMFPSVAEPNSQSMRKLSMRSCQPSLAPTKPQLTREKPQLAAMASDHSFFQASNALWPQNPRRAPVACAAAIEMRSQQRINLEPRQQSGIASSRTRCNTTEWCGSQMISLMRV